MQRQLKKRDSNFQNCHLFRKTGIRYGFTGLLQSQRASDMASPTHRALEHNPNKANRPPGMVALLG